MKRFIVFLIALSLLVGTYGCSSSESKSSEHTHESGVDVSDSIGEDTAEPEDEPVIIDYHIGQSVAYGRYEQDGNTENGKELLKWVVADIRGGSYLLVAKKVIDTVPYNKDAGETTWEECSLREWLNSDFYQDSFTKAEKEHIKLSELTNSDNSDTGAHGGDTTEDRVFLLSQNEAVAYFGNDNVRKSYATEYAVSRGVTAEEDGRCSWWLRTPGETNSMATLVGTDGQIIPDSHEADVESTGYGVRPAIWVEA